MKSTQVPIHRAPITLTELTKTRTWDQGWKQMQSRREIYMAEGSVGLGSSLGTSRGLSVQPCQQLGWSHQSAGCGKLQGLFQSRRQASGMRTSIQFLNAWVCPPGLPQELVKFIFLRCVCASVLCALGTVRLVDMCLSLCM